MSNYSPNVGDVDAVFKALADDSRRLLLDGLRARDGQTLTELCALLPQMTRFGVSAHLGVLEGAGLVTVVREGRHKRHYLNAVPLRQIQRRWLSDFTAAMADDLLAMRDRLERQETPMEQQKSVFTIYIDAPRQAVWDELTRLDRVRPWLYDTVLTSPGFQPGNPYEMRTTDGKLMMDGTVEECREPAFLAMSFTFRWDEEVEAAGLGRDEYELVEEHGQTRLTVTTTASPAALAESDSGTPWIYSALKSYLERPAA